MKQKTLNYTDLSQAISAIAVGGNGFGGGHKSLEDDSTVGEKINRYSYSKAKEENDR